MAALAVAALYDLGATDPDRHIFVATAGNIATLIVTKNPFNPADMAALKKAARELNFKILAAPDQASDLPELGNIVSAESISELVLVTSRFASGLDLTPPSDERPFFFNQLPLSDIDQLVRLVSSFLADDEAGGVIRGNLIATATLAFLFLVSLTLVLITVIVPLKPAIEDAGPGLAIGGTFYFLLLGVGFMTFEIALLQRMSIFLGHPIYSLGIVLFTLVLSTGVGSLISHRYPLTNLTKFTTWSFVSGVYILLMSFFLPTILVGFESSEMTIKAFLSISFIMPAGLLLGFGFPSGLRLVSCVSSKPAPWFWGINGAAGVLASIMAVGCSIAFGIRFTMVLGAGCYFLLVPAAIAIGFRGIRDRADNVEKISCISN
jgi:hypothetical protein